MRNLILIIGPIGMGLGLLAGGMVGCVAETPETGTLYERLQNEDPDVRIQAAVQAGPLIYNATNTAFLVHNTIILQESDYTAAMRAAGNVYIDPAGQTYYIVGLHAVPAAPA